MTSVWARMVHDADHVAWYVGRSALLPCGVGHGRHATWRSPSCTRLQGASMMRRSWNMGDKKTWSLGAQQGRYGGVSRGSSASHFTVLLLLWPGGAAVCDDVGGQRHRTCKLESVYARGGVKQHGVGYGGSGSTLSLRHDSKPAQTLGNGSVTKRLLSSCCSQCYQYCVLTFALPFITRHHRSDL